MKRQERKGQRPVEDLRKAVLDLRERVREAEADASAASGVALRAQLANAPDGNSLALRRDEVLARLQAARADLAQAEAALRDALRPELDSLRREAEAYDARVIEQTREAEAKLAAMVVDAAVLLRQLAKTPQVYAETVRGLEERGQRLLAESLGTLSVEPLRLKWERHGLGMLAMELERLAQLALAV